MCVCQGAWEWESVGPVAMAMKGWYFSCRAVTVASLRLVIGQSPLRSGKLDNTTCPEWVAMTSCGRCVLINWYCGYYVLCLMSKTYCSLKCVKFWRWNRRPGLQLISQKRKSRTPIVLRECSCSYLRLPNDGTANVIDVDMPWCRWKELWDGITFLKMIW